MPAPASVSQSGTGRCAEPGETLKVIIKCPAPEALRVIKRYAAQKGQQQEAFYAM
jgi:TusA-related sulfurtransferase